MAVPKDERDRILHMIEAGQVRASEAAQLLDTLEDERAPYSQRPAERERTLYIRYSNLHSRQQRVQVTATIPLSILKAGLRLSSRLMPQLNTNAAEDLLHMLEQGATGRLLDVQDLEKGERIEVVSFNPSSGLKSTTGAHRS